MGFMDQVRTVNSPLRQRANSKRAFIASTNLLGVSIANTIRTAIQNPVGSGRIIVIDHFEASTFAGAALQGNLVINPTTNLPNLTDGNSERLKITNLRPSATDPSKSDSIAKIACSSGNAMGGGYDPGILIDLSKEISETPWHIEEGVTFGINVPFILAQKGSFSLYWWEMET